MAAKSKKRLSKIENKLLKLDKLEVKDVLCSICQSILIEPVTLPCFHDFCLRCFNGSIENNALCCPLCRLRIGSWLRTTTKQKNLVNIKLWHFIQSKFSQEIDIKIKGGDISLPEERPTLRLSEPGEIRLEYEAELNRLRAERERLEQKHLAETELLIKKIQLEEEEAQKKYQQTLKQDEILAHQILQEHMEDAVITPNTSRKPNSKETVTKPKLKTTKINTYLSKLKAPITKDSPLLTDDNTSTDGSTPKIQPSKIINGGSPEMVPSYGKLIKSLIDKKVKNTSSLWNKENGDSVKEMKFDAPKPIEKQLSSTEEKVKAKGPIPSLLVSLPLPYTGLLQHKINATESRNIETGSVDSMRQELCHFKPIESTSPTEFLTKTLPIRVPGLRVEKDATVTACEAAQPTRSQYLEGLCRLRNISLAKNLPSAFVIAINVLKVGKETSIKCEMNRSKVKKNTPTSPNGRKRNVSRNKQASNSEGITKLNNRTNLRRTRSMGSISKDENETTPKKSKIKQRKVSSERKPYLRSDSKKSNTKNETSSPPLISETMNNNKINLAVKNLSSPLKNCDVTKILQEQLRIEKLIEQEKNDFELAQKMEAEWNGRRILRRSSVKRQVTINYALRPAKKLKV